VPRPCLVRRVGRGTRTADGGGRVVYSGPLA